MIGPDVFVKILKMSRVGLYRIDLSAGSDYIRKLERIVSGAAPHIRYFHTGAKAELFDVLLRCLPVDSHPESGLSF